MRPLLQNSTSSLKWDQELSNRSCLPLNTARFGTFLIAVWKQLSDSVRSTEPTDLHRVPAFRNKAWFRILKNPGNLNHNDPDKQGSDKVCWASVWFAGQELSPHVPFKCFFSTGYYFLKTGGGEGGSINNCKRSTLPRGKSCPGGSPRPGG